MTGDRVAVDTATVWPDDVDEEQGVVVNWFVREGASVEEGEEICEIQIEKVGIDVPAPATGTIDEIEIEEDGEFDHGDTLAWIDPE